MDPPRIQIPGKSSAEITVTGFCSSPGLVEERLTCLSVPPSGKGGKVIFDCTFKAAVTAPLLTFDCDSMDFEYWYEKGVDAVKQTQALEIANVSPLPLTFTLSVNRPFEIDRPHWTLEPQEAGTVQLSFDPMYKRDLKSIFVQSKVNIRYSDNPQVDSLNVSADINFPNIHHSADSINFGNCLSDTKKRSYITLTNTSKVPAVFQWVLLEPEEEQHRPGSPSPPGSPSSKSASSSKRLPNNQVFDILPINGVMAPGDQIKVEFSYFSYPGFKAECEAVLEVEGGPYATVMLSGESSTIQFSLEPREMDLGQQLYDRTVERELVLWNQGKVAIQYDIDLLSLSRPGVVVVLPTKFGLPGTLPAGQKETFRLKVRPGIPEMLNEVVLVAIGPFEPIPIKINVEGCYSGFFLTIPRSPSDEVKFMEAMEQAQHSIGVDGPKLGICQIQPDRRARSIAPSRAAAQRPGSAKSKMSLLEETRSVAGTALGDGSKSMVGARSVAGTMVTMQGPSPMEVEIETEVERLLMCGYLLEKEAEEFTALLDLPPTKGEIPDVRRQSDNGDSNAATSKATDLADIKDFATREGRTLLQKRLANPDVVRKSYPVVLSEYCLDLGYVVKVSHLSCELLGVQLGRE